MFLVIEYFAAYVATPAAWPFGFGSMAFNTVVPQGKVQFVENLFAESLFEQGLIGFTLMMIVICNTTRYVVFMVRNAPTEQQRNNAIVLGGLLTMSFLIAAKSYNLWTGFPFFYLCIVATKIGITARRDLLLAREDEDYEFEDEVEYLEYEDHPDSDDEFGEVELPHPA